VCNVSLFVSHEVVARLAVITCCQREGAEGARFNLHSTDAIVALNDVALLELLYTINN